MEDHTDIGAAIDDTHSQETGAGTPFRSINNQGSKVRDLELGDIKPCSPRPSFEGGTKMPEKMLSAHLKSSYQSNMSIDSCDGCDSMSEYTENEERPQVATRRSKKKSQFFKADHQNSLKYHKQRSTLQRRSKSFCRHHLKGDDEDSEEYEARIAKRVQEKQMSKMLKSRTKDPSTLKRTK